MYIVCICVVLETTKENIRTAKDGIQRFKQQRAEQSLRKQASQNTSSAIKTVDKAEKTIKQSAQNYTANFINESKSLLSFAH
jgi:hypothetical protein